MGVTKKIFLFLAAFAVVASVLILVGYVWQEGIIDSSVNDEGSKILTPLEAWWTTAWSKDGAEVNVDYVQGGNTLNETDYVENGYSPYGVQVAGSEVIHRTGVDIYGREQNMTIGVLSSWSGGTVKPNSVIANGTFTCPAGAEFEQAWFGLNLEVTVNCEYNDMGQLAGGSGNEEFSGHLSTSTGKISFAGNVTATFEPMYGEITWTNSTEKTEYYYEGKPYAETVTATIPQSELIGGNLVIVQETVRTTTAFADGSHRESEIVISWQRNDLGVCTGKSAGGTVVGTEIMNGNRVNYSGSIVFDYGFDSRLGWYKTGYTETRSRNTGLPERLPFEAIFVDDPYLRPVF
jgi:hypothetical protein